MKTDVLAAAFNRLCELHDLSYNPARHVATGALFWLLGEVPDDDSEYMIDGDGVHLICVAGEIIGSVDGVDITTGALVLDFDESAQ